MSVITWGIQEETGMCSQTQFVNQVLKTDGWKVFFSLSKPQPSKMINQSSITVQVHIFTDLFMCELFLFYHDCDQNANL